MEAIIDKIYIISSDDTKFKKLKYSLKTNIPIVKVKSIDDSKITNKMAEKVSTQKCQYLCSNKTIGDYLTHYNLWKNISKKEKRVMILDENIIPEKYFSSLLEEYWKSIPNKWDIVYLGCNGSCKSTARDTIYKLTKSRSNSDIYKNGKRLYYVIEPGYPLGLYGYVLSQSGIKKLLSNKNLKLIDNNLDVSIANEITRNPNFKVYAFDPSLVKFNEGHLEPHHKIFDPIGKKIKISDDKLSDLWYSEMVYIRPLNVSVSYLTFVLMIAAVIIGYFTNVKTQRNFLSILTFIQLVEIAYTDTSKQKIKDLLFELSLVYLSYLTGGYSKIYIDNKN
jgi:GR25 family glycosyltransferase involved in LPS biosynthesis